MDLTIKEIIILIVTSLLIGFGIGLLSISWYFGG